MKILQTNDSELELNTSGATNLILAGVLVVIGVGVMVSPLFTSAEWWVSLIGLAIFGLAVAMVFTATSTHTVLRRGGTSVMIEKKLVGGATKEATFESSQVAHVKLESHTEVDVSSSSDANGRSGQQQRQRVSNLYIVLVDGTEITVGSERRNGNGGFSVNGVGLSSISKAPLSNEGKQIADFFGVPLKTGLQDVSMQDVIGAVQTAFAKPAGTVTQTPATERPAAAQLANPSVPTPPPLSTQTPPRES